METPEVSPEDNRLVIFTSFTSGADPGFPRGGGANSPGGAATYNFAKISQKPHETAPPLRSATAHCLTFFPRFKKN